MRLLSPMILGVLYSKYGLSQPPKSSIATCYGPTLTWLTILSPSVTIVNPSLMDHSMDARTLFFPNAIKLTSSPTLFHTSKCILPLWLLEFLLCPQQSLPHLQCLFWKFPLPVALNEIWLLPEHVPSRFPLKYRHILSSIPYSPYSLKMEWVSTSFPLVTPELFHIFF